MSTRWTNRTIDLALHELRDASRTQPVFSLEWEQALQARVHREVEARFGVGAWNTPLMAHRSETDSARMQDVHTDAVRRVGMMEVFRSLVRQPALALATVVLLVAGVLAYRTSDDATLATRMRDPQTSSAVAVTSAVPFGDGTGFAVSVFGGSLAVAPTRAIVPASSMRTTVRRSASLPLNPARGVFTQWGTSVFSDDEMRTHARDAKGVFGS